MHENIIQTLHEPVMAVLGIGISFVALFILYRALRMKNQERMSLIEKNMDPSLAGKYFESGIKDFRKIGSILIATAIGVISGYIINLTLGIPDFVSYSTMILLSCGIALIYLHKTDKK